MLGLGSGAPLAFALGAGTGSAPATYPPYSPVYRLISEAQPRGLRFANVANGRSEMLSVHGPCDLGNVHAPCVTVGSLPSDNSSLSGVVRRRFWKKSDYLPSSVNLPEYRYIGLDGERDHSEGD